MTVAIITGGSSGIGQATIELFHKRGIRTYNLDIQQPNNLHEGFISCDVTDYSQIQSAMEYIAKRETSIDYVVSNAGQHFSGTIEDSSIHDFEKIIDTNVKSAFMLLKESIPFMKFQQQGSIVLVGSDQSLIGKAQSTLYGMSKSALTTLTRSVAIDYAEHGIRANCICPGTVDTPFFRNAIKNASQATGLSVDQIKQNEDSLQPLGRIGQPHEIAQLINFLCSDQSSFITGALLPIDGGYTAQ